MYVGACAAWVVDCLELQIMYVGACAAWVVDCLELQIMCALCFRHVCRSLCYVGRGLP